MSPRRQLQRVAVVFDADGRVAVSPDRAKETTGTRADVDDQTTMGRVAFDLADDEFVLAPEPPVVRLDERHRRIRVGRHDRRAIAALGPPGPGCPLKGPPGPGCPLKGPPGPGCALKGPLGPGCALKGPLAPYRTTNRDRRSRHVEAVSQWPDAAAVAVVPAHRHRRRADAVVSGAGEQLDVE